MLLSNSRIEKDNKIRFYEQDILLDDYVYSGNLQVTMDVDYLNPGIGIALVSNEGLSLEEDGETYLFRIGHSDYSIMRRLGDRIEGLENGPVMNIKPFKENLKLKIKKINSIVYFYANDALISKRYLPTNLNSFIVGYYSSAGNVINSISIASEIPDGWVVNMNNTDGGYVKFAPNMFSTTNCADKAEIEQVKISLKANTAKNPCYYLNYVAEGETNDFKAYIFKSNDIRYSDEEKNILDKDGYFVLKDDCEVNLKFVGTKGVIENIQITNSADDFYVGTDYNMAEIKESFIKIKTKELTKIEWVGTIFGAPEYDYNNPDVEKFGIVRDNDKIYYPKMLGVYVGKEYEYNYILEINKNQPMDILTTKYKNEIHQFELNVLDFVNIFENVDGIITKLLLYKEDGTVINVLIEDTKKQYVPAAIKSPIIVTTETEEPLDLSTSYRAIQSENGLEYIFTNTEREIFSPANRIKLTNMPSSKLDTIVVYGILNHSETYPGKILWAQDESIKDISLYTDDYEIIRESSLYTVNKDTGLIVITDMDDDYIKSKYKEIVVDYLKKDSYAINYRHELNSYEVDISTTQNTKIYYDGIASKAENGLVNVEEYKLLNTTFRNNSYIVLREGDR